MRFIGVLRNAAKTGDEYPNEDRMRGERTGKEKEGGGSGYRGIDRRKGEIRPPPRRAIFVRAHTPRAPIVRYLRRMHFVRTVTILFPSNFRCVNFIS